MTGGAGYIGSIAVRKLLAKGYSVRVMDILDFGAASLTDIIDHENFELYKGDIRQLDNIEHALHDIGGIIHLAAIVGDPACAVQGGVAVETNYLSTLRLAMAAKSAEIPKFIFSSTCSVYGASDAILDEGSALNPQSLYAETKILAENELRDLSDKDFEPIIFRLGTLYGLSPRLRFDLVINFITAKIMRENKASIFGGGQWRPFVHVEEAAGGFVYAYENYDKMKGETYNLGENSENYQMKDIGKIFEHVFPDAELDYMDKVKDPRSYHVSFDKLRGYGYELKRTVKPSIVELRDYIHDNGINTKDLNYYNYNPGRDFGATTNNKT